MNPLRGTEEEQPDDERAAMKTGPADVADKVTVEDVNTRRGWLHGGDSGDGGQMTGAGLPCGWTRGGGGYELDEGERSSARWPRQT